MKPYGFRPRAWDFDGDDEAGRWSEAHRMAELRTALDHLMPRWWNGRRIHTWRSARTLIVYDEVADYIWLH